MGKLRRIQQIPLQDRPREKLQNKGPASLSDFELLEVLIGNGSRHYDVGYIARQIQKQLRKGTDHLSYESLAAVSGVSVAQASKIMAALELAKRHLLRDIEPLATIKDILARLDDIRAKPQEYVVCLTLDGGQRLIAKRTITIGTLDTAIVHPREVFADAIADRAATVVLVHNHPSGDPHPSHKDIEITQQLTSAGHLLGIQLRDHIIVTKTEYYSFQQHHLL